MAQKRNDVNNVDSINKFKQINNIAPQEPLTPIPLLKRPPKDYPVHALGNELAEIVREMQRVIKAPMAICAQSVLAAVSFCCQSHANVHVDSMIYPLSLFFFTVAQSGERKSAVDSVALKPIANFEKNLQTKFEVDLQRYEYEINNFKQGKNGLMSIPVRPREPTMIMTEPTYEGIVKVFEKGQPSLALFSDEGGNFLSGYAMNADNRIRTVAGLSSLWDGSPISKVRSGEGSLKLYDKRLAFHLMIQPGLALRLFNDGGLVDQGFVARCLIIYPESTMGNREYTAENIQQSTAYQKYNEKLTALLECRPPAYRELHLSVEAKAFYLDFYRIIEGKLKVDGEYRDIAGFANKMLNQACRIAGTLTLYENPRATEISRQAFANAYLLVMHYESENMRLIGESTLVLAPLCLEEKHQHAHALYSWLTDKKNIDKYFPEGLVRLRTVQQYASRRIKKKHDVAELLGILVEYEYLTKVPETHNMWEIPDYSKFTQSVVTVDAL